jgi:dipeptidase E
VTPTILAMGGGGFTMDPANPALDDFMLSLAPRAEPRVLFLPTASGDPAAQIAAFHTRFNDRACDPQHLSLFRLHGDERSLADVVLRQDIVYVGGGSMRNLLAIWRAHGLDLILCEAWRQGVVLAGPSAGGMCWFEGGVTRSGGPPEPIAGLGLLPGSLSVHADAELERLPAFREAIRRGALPGGWAADDDVGLLFRERRLVRTLTARPGAGLLRVDRIDGELVTAPIEPEQLADGRRHIPPPPDDVLELRSLAGMRRGVVRDRWDPMR